MTRLKQQLNAVSRETHFQFGNQSYFRSFWNFWWPSSFGFAFFLCNVNVILSKHHLPVYVWRFFLLLLDLSLLPLMFERLPIAGFGVH